VLNALHRFALAAFSGTVVSLVAIAALVVYGSSTGIYALALGTTLGFLAQWAMLARGIQQQGMPVRASFGMRDADLDTVRHQAYTLMLGTALMGSTELVDQSMAAVLEAGSVAALGYGTKVVLLALGLGAAAIGTSVFPHFSAMVAARDWNGARHTLVRYGQLILLASIPLTFIIVAASEWIVTAVFQRGAFGAADTLAVARVQALYALQIPFYLLGILGVRLLSAMGKNRTVTTIAAFNVVSNIVGNAMLMRWFGVAGIALSTSIVYLLSCALIWFVLLRTLNRA
jgi:putative peptidoglycan lipid II flippase